jgi:hypothetical protein
MTLPLKHIIDKMNGICRMPPRFELELMHSIERIEIPKNYVLLERGQICDHYYYIEKGILSCHELDDAGLKEYCTWLMFPGDIATSILSFNERVPSVDSIRAAKKCILHLLPWKAVDRFTRQSREFAYIRQTLTNKYYLRFSEMGAMRLRPAEQFFQYLETLYGDDFYRVPVRIMATHLGISETTYYEIKKNFGRDVRKNGKH